MFKFWSIFHIQNRATWIETIVSYKPPPNLSQKNRNTLTPASLDTTATLIMWTFPQLWTIVRQIKRIRYRRDGNAGQKSFEKLIKKQTVLHAIQVCKGTYFPYFKINDPIFCCPLFFEEPLCPQVRINKMVSEHTVNYHPRPSELTSRIHPLILQWTPKWFMSPEYFLNFFSNLQIPPWLQKSFKFMVLRLLET